MNKYTKIIMWSNDDDCYIVSVPELPGCMADGKTQEEALKNADVIIEEWIQTAELEGREVPQPNGFMSV